MLCELESVFRRNFFIFQMLDLHIMNAGQRMRANYGKIVVCGFAIALALALCFALYFCPVIFALYFALLLEFI